MKIAYCDAFSGISGDMLVAALLDLGLELDRLEAEFAKLPLDGYTVQQSERVVNGIRAVGFNVDVEEGRQPERSFRSISSMLAASSLDPAVKATAGEIFAKLAAAEAHVHRVSVEDVHFHEVGAVDSILDVVGIAVGLHTLGIQAVYTSPLPLGSGLVSARHGRLPVPGPATTELLKGFPVRFEDGASELVTPTGAAVLAALARPGPPEFSIARTGYGAGQRQLADRPNVLRVCLGDCPPDDRSTGLRLDHLMVLETHIDDLNPEWYEHVMERLFAAGARDVSVTPVHMKKNRPGILLWVLCDPENQDRLSHIILTETSTLGLRSYPVSRLSLRREYRNVVTKYGTVRVKCSYPPDGRVNHSPEYDDCKRLARQHGVPLGAVYEAATLAVQRLGVSPTNDEE